MDTDDFPETELELSRLDGDGWVTASEEGMASQGLGLDQCGEQPGINHDATAALANLEALKAAVANLRAWIADPTTFEYPLVEDVETVLAALGE